MKRMHLETTFKPPPPILTIDQQRERERQRLKDEEERRKKLLMRKDHQQTVQLPPVPKFEPLTIDTNTDETRRNKSKTPNAGTGTFSPHFPLANGATTATTTTTNKFLPKPKPTTPIQKSTNQDENNPNHAETTAIVPKRIVIKKRSSVLVSSIFIH